jgi:hypothetical protein
MEGISLTIVGSEGGEEGDGQERNAGRESAHLQLLFLCLTFAGLEQIGVRLELEDEVGDINEEQEDRGPTGDDEKTGSATLLDGTGLAGLEEDVEHVILDGLRHEIGGGNDKRFWWKVKNQIEECGNPKNTY